MDGITFMWSPWIIGSLILYGAIICFVTFVVIGIRCEITRKDPSARLVTTGLTAGIIVSLVAVNVMSSVASSVSDGSTRHAISDQDFAKEFFGFESGKAYPVVLGGQATSFKAAAYGGFFTAQAVVQGGAAFIVSYTHDGKSWDIVVPLSSNTSFDDPDATESTITLFLEPSGYYFDAHYEQGYGWKDCKRVISNLTLSRHCTKQMHEMGPLRYNEEAAALGLAAWLQDRIVRSELRSTPEMHHQVIGKAPQPAP